MARVIYAGRGQYRAVKANRGFTKAEKKAERKASTVAKLIAARKGLVTIRSNRLRLIRLIQSL